jgi:hypothetical protein
MAAKRRKKRKKFYFFAPFAILRGYSFGARLVYAIFHAPILAHIRKNDKPTVGFRALFFWRGWSVACCCSAKACKAGNPTK